MIQVQVPAPICTVFIRFHVFAHMPEKRTVGMSVHLSTRSFSSAVELNRSKFELIVHGDSAV